MRHKVTAKLLPVYLCDTCQRYWWEFMLILPLLTSADLERTMVSVGAVRSGDPRLHASKAEDESASTNKIRRGTVAGDEDDSDWD